MQEVTTGMREKGVKHLELVDRGEWRIKIKLKLQARKACKYQDSVHE